MGSLHQSLWKSVCHKQLEQALKLRHISLIAACQSLTHTPYPYDLKNYNSQHQQSQTQEKEYTLSKPR